MIKKTFVLLFAVAFVIGLSQPALADYVDPPDWSDNPHYTHQGWDFNTDPWDEDGIFIPQEPDGEPAWVNPYGTPYFSDADGGGGMMGWGWISSMCGREGEIGGDSGYVEFYVPNTGPPPPVKELWLQYIVYLPTAGPGPGGATTTTITTTGGEDATLIDKSWVETTGSGSSGLWWQVTELWTIIPQPENGEIVNIFASNEGGMAVLFDEVDIDTRCVPIPGAVWLLGSGLVGLIGIRRRKRA